MSGPGAYAGATGSGSVVFLSTENRSLTPPTRAGPITTSGLRLLTGLVYELPNSRFGALRPEAHHLRRLVVGEAGAPAQGLGAGRLAATLAAGERVHEWQRRPEAAAPLGLGGARSGRRGA